MNVFAEHAALVRAALQTLIADGRLPAGLDLGRFSVEPPRDPAHGDVSTNAAMVYAPEAKAAFGAPRKLAEALAGRLSTAPSVASVEIAGPGFINMRLRPAVFEAALKAALAAPADYGRGAPTGRRVNVEYVSANPTGPLHVGHARGAAYGDALARLLAFAGDEVTKEFYVNDAGSQVDTLARSAFLRYQEALGEAIGAIPEGLYPGDYLKPVGAELAAQYGRSLLDRPEAERHALVRDFAIAAMLEAIRADLARLGIAHDRFFSERSLLAKGPDGKDEVTRCIEALRARDLVYVGRLPPPKGQPQEDWEDREQTLFRSSQFGDDVDRPLLKSDGAYTYFASDIAYHADKVSRGFVRLVDVLGADHGGYAKRIGASVKALSDGKVALDVKFCQLVRLMRAGQPVKMSKRSGEFVTLAEVVDEVGPDAIRFILLTRRNDAPLDFDLDKVIEQSKDNPVFYVQYAHARCRSALRQAREAFPSLDVSAPALAGADLSRLDAPGERALLALLAQWPRQVEAAAAANEPHRIAFHAIELATAFHAHWNVGKDQPHLRFVVAQDEGLTRARAATVAGVAAVLASALGVLGVAAPEEMR